MADVIVLSDQSVQTVFEPKDFEYLVEKYMGYDAEKYFREMAEQFQDEVEAAQDKTTSDLGAYEASLESNTSCFQEILEVMEQMETILEAPRVNKNKLFKLIEQVQKEINNQI